MDARELERLLNEQQKGNETLHRLAQARDFLRSQANVQEAKQIGMSLASSAGLDGIMFGLGVLHELVSKRNTELGNEDVMECLETSISILELQGGNHHFASHSKAAAIVSECVVRLEGSPLSDVLARLEMRVENDIGIESHCLFMRSLCEDAALLRDTTTEAESRQVLSQLVSNTSRCLSFLSRALTSPNVSERAMRAALSAAEAFTEWAPIDEMHSHRLVGSIGGLMQHESLGTDALNAVRPLAMRKAEAASAATHNDDNAIPKAMSQFCDLLSETLSSFIDDGKHAAKWDPSNIEEHDHLLSLMHAISHFVSSGSFLLVSQFKAHSSNALVNAMLRVAHTGYITPSAPLLWSFSAILSPRGSSASSHGTSSSSSCLPSGAFDELAKVCAEWLLAGGGISEGLRPKGGAHELWVRELDLAGAGETVFQAWTVLKVCLRDLSKSLGGSYAPVSSAKMAGTLLSRASGSWKGETNVAADLENAMSFLDGAASFAGPALSKLPANVASNPPSELVDGVMSVMNLEPPSTDTTSRVSFFLAAAIESVGGILGSQAELASSVIGMLFRMLQALPNRSGGMPARAREANSAVGDYTTTKLSRQRVGTALVTVCERSKGTLSNHVDEFASHAMSLNLRGAENSAIKEALITLAGEERVPVMVNWALEGPRSRLGKGLSRNAVSFFLCGSDEMGASQQRWEVFHDVQLIDRALRRVLRTETVSPGEGVVDGGFSASVPTRGTVTVLTETGVLNWAVPALSQMLSQIQELFDRETEASQAMPERYAPTLQASPEEISAAMSQGPVRESPVTDDGTVAQDIMELRSWLRNLRESALVTMCVMLTNAPVSYLNDWNTVSAVLEAGCSHMHKMLARHYALTMKTLISPLFMRLPRNTRRMAITNFSHILLDMGRRLVSSPPGRLLHTHNGDQNDKGGTPPTEMEVFHDQTWRDALRETLHFYLALLQHNSVLASPANKRKHETTTSHKQAGDPTSDAAPTKGSHLTAQSKRAWVEEVDEAHANGMLEVAGEALSANDSKVAHKALLVCRCISAMREVANGNMLAIQQNLCSRVMVQSLMALANRTNSSHAPEILSLICDGVTSSNGNAAMSVIASTCRVDAGRAGETLRRISVNASEKENRAVLKGFFQKTIGLENVPALGVKDGASSVGLSRKPVPRRVSDMPALSDDDHASGTSGLPALNFNDE